MSGNIYILSFFHQLLFTIMFYNSIVSCCN